MGVSSTNQNSQYGRERNYDDNNRYREQNQRVHILEENRRLEEKCLCLANIQKITINIKLS
jgi:hypothetical protein